MLWSVCKLRGPYELYGPLKRSAKIFELPVNGMQFTGRKYLHTVRMSNSRTVRIVQTVKPSTSLRNLNEMQFTEPQIPSYGPYVKFTDRANCTDRVDHLPLGEIDGPKPYFYGSLQCRCIGQPSSSDETSEIRPRGR